MHAAAQPSHDWSALEPLEDFSINATATIQILEALRLYSKETCMVHISTNKVYGARPNDLPLMEKKSRWEFKSDENQNGIDETLAIDHTMHSPFWC